MVVFMRMLIILIPSVLALYGGWRWIVKPVVYRLRFGRDAPAIMKRERDLRIKKRQNAHKERMTELDAQAFALERAQAELEKRRDELGEKEFQRLMDQLDMASSERHGRERTGNVRKRLPGLQGAKGEKK